MLPPALQQIKTALMTKGYSNRSRFEDAVLDELNEVDDALNKAKAAKSDLTRGIEKKGNYGPGVVGPTPGSCTICGKII